MNKIKLQKIKRVRSKISGDAVRPRLAVFRSNAHISAQLIDDVNGVTLVAASDTEIKDAKNKAEEVGKLLAKKAIDKKITSAVFDRRWYNFHGQVKMLAEAAISGGLKI